MTPADVASRFESLGGGGLNPNGWGFGCEFGFWQRSLAVEPIGLLRWASIKPENLINGLRSGFAGVGNSDAITFRDNPVDDWCVTQTTYGLYIDHTGMKRTEIPEREAAIRYAKFLDFLRRKFVEDIAAAEKVFVYRTYDHTLNDDTQEALAASIGRGTLLYVQIAPPDRQAFTVERKSDHLIVGYIDRFAPRNGRLDYNPKGWEAVCRSALELCGEKTSTIQGLRLAGSP